MRKAFISFPENIENNDLFVYYFDSYVPLMIERNDTTCSSAYYAEYLIGAYISENPELQDAYVFVQDFNAIIKVHMDYCIYGGGFLRYPHLKTESEYTIYDKDGSKMLNFTWEIEGIKLPMEIECEYLGIPAIFHFDESMQHEILSQEKVLSEYYWLS